MVGGTDRQVRQISNTCVGAGALTMIPTVVVDVLLRLLLGCGNGGDNSSIQI